MLAALTALLTNVLHDLVLTLAWDRRVREDDPETLPPRGRVQPCLHIVAEPLCQLCHELGARCDDVGIKANLMEK